MLKFLHFSDNRNESDKTDKNYGKLWKITIFAKLSDANDKYYSPTEHLAVDENNFLSRWLSSGL
jgi:hypothetical protein